MTKQEYFSRLHTMGKAGAVTQEAVRYLSLRNSLDERTDNFLRLAFRVMEHEQYKLERTGDSNLSLNTDDPKDCIIIIQDIERVVTSRWVELMSEVRLQQAKGVYKADRSSSEYIHTRERLAREYPFPKANDRFNSTQKATYRESRRVWLHTLDLIAELELERMTLSGA